MKKSCDENKIWLRGHALMSTFCHHCSNWTKFLLTFSSGHSDSPNAIAFTLILFIPYFFLKKPLLLVDNAFLLLEANIFITKLSLCTEIYRIVSQKSALSPGGGDEDTIRPGANLETINVKPSTVNTDAVKKQCSNCST